MIVLKSTKLHDASAFSLPGDDVSLAKKRLLCSHLLTSTSTFTFTRLGTTNFHFYYLISKLDVDVVVAALVNALFVFC